MFQQWTRQWSQLPIPGAPAQTPALKAAVGNTRNEQQSPAFPQHLAEAVTDMLTKHRETLDAQYRAGIRTIEDAFRVVEAKDPEQFRKLAEELWRQSFESLKTVTETQLRDFQAVAEKGIEVLSKGMSAAKV